MIMHLSLSIYIYIYTYDYASFSLYIYTYDYASLSLYLYIDMHNHILVFSYWCVNSKLDELRRHEVVQLILHKGIESLSQTLIY